MHSGIAQMKVRILAAGFCTGPGQGGKQDAGMAQDQFSGSVCVSTAPRSWVGDTVDHPRCYDCTGRSPEKLLALSTHRVL